MLITFSLNFVKLIREVRPSPNFIRIAIIFGSEVVLLKRWEYLIIELTTTKAGHH